MCVEDSEVLDSADTKGQKLPLIRDSGVASSLDTDTDTNSECPDQDEDDDIVMPAVTVVPTSASAQNRRRRFSEDRPVTVSSVTPLLLKETGLTEKLEKEKSLSAPSFLLHKVKERIQKHIFHSSEWSTAAAIFEERRQRVLTECLDERAAKLGKDGEGKEYVPLKDISSKSNDRRSRTRSDISSTKRSDNTGHSHRRHFTAPVIKLRRPSDAVVVETNCSIDKEGGVVCSNEDLLAILLNYKSTASIDKPEYTRTQSLDERRDSLLKQLSTHSAPSKMEIHGDSETNVAGSTDDVDGENRPLYPEIQVTNTEGNITLIDNPFHFPEDNNVEAPKVREVTYDENGLTWDVYGADFDAQILGDAIQTHLENLSGKDEDDDSEPIQKTNTHKARMRSFWQRLFCMHKHKSRQVT